MNRDQITLFLTPQRAQEAATGAYRSNQDIDGHRIIRGKATWEDRRVDHGYKVKLIMKDGTTSYL